MTCYDTSVLEALYQQQKKYSIILFKYIGMTAAYSLATSQG